MFPAPLCFLRNYLTQKKPLKRTFVKSLSLLTSSFHFLFWLRHNSHRNQNKKQIVSSSTLFFTKLPDTEKTTKKNFLSAFWQVLFSFSLLIATQSSQFKLFQLHFVFSDTEKTTKKNFCQIDKFFSFFSFDWHNSHRNQNKKTNCFQLHFVFYEITWHRKNH